uniref:Acetyl-CoA carboxylase carboxyltransferase beta subunit n=1 Tax=Teucrium mascatense TaxID=2172029 RepID=A0A4Y6I4E2_9LAMI|nr:acetyl-CoA carboxylase carboxyltransferase beta subunit [Teucrium mascatense]QDF64454.1 acetyl-CoA carboxylase carboxyltransferase beta subunit [Teucrium mascatense]
MTIHLLYFYTNYTNRGQEDSMERWYSMVFKKELERRYGIKKLTHNLCVNQWIVLVLLKIPVYVRTGLYMIRIKTFIVGVIVTVLVTVMLIISLASGTFAISSLMIPFLLGIVIGTVIPSILILKIRFLRLATIILFWVNWKVLFLVIAILVISIMDLRMKIPYPIVTCTILNLVGIITLRMVIIFGMMTSCIASYLQSQIYDTSVVSDSGDSAKSSDLTLRERSSDRDFSHLWVLCENCYELNYKQFLKSKMNICEQCGYHLQMSSSERIELSIDPDTWDPMDEDMFSLDAIGFSSETDDSDDSYQKDTELTEAIQTGVGQLNGIPVAIGVMDFDFLGGLYGIRSRGENYPFDWVRYQSLSTSYYSVCFGGGAHARGKFELDANGKNLICLICLSIKKKVILCINPHISYYWWGNRLFWYAGRYYYRRTKFLHCICGYKSNWRNNYGNSTRRFTSDRIFIRKGLIRPDCPPYSFKKRSGRVI